MNVLSISFPILFVVMFGGTIALILNISLVKKESIKNKITIGIIGLIVLSMITFMGGIVPVSILTNLEGFEGMEGIIYVILACIVVYILITIFNNIRNVIILNKNDVKDIYIRDVEVSYSPAVLSFLKNQRVEESKDLPATLLNLCAKGILKLEKEEKGNIRIIDLKKDKEIWKLSEDEKYAYEMFVEGVTTSKIKTWKKKVEEQYNKYGFSKKNKTTLANYMMLLYAFIFIAVFIYCIITGNNVITGNLAEVIIKIIPIIFFAAWESIIVYAIRQGMVTISNKNLSKEFKDKYTVKGAREYMKWKKFENFIEDFTLVKDRDYTSIVLLGKYLSYSIALGINDKCDNELYDKIKKEYTFRLDLMEYFNSINN